jgi:hypothetical protein
VALPIFQTIIRAAWASGVPKAALAPPSSEAKRLIADLPIDIGTGEQLGKGGRGAFVEHFRLDEKGAVLERKSRFSAYGNDGRKKSQDHRRVARTQAPRRAPAQSQNVVTQCVLFFCTTAPPPSSMW